MEMHQVRYFLAVARTLNFTRAAEECNVSQPSLTRAVKLLEHELGGDLLRRERGLTHLTELGERMHPLLAQCHEAASSAREIARAIKSGKAATLRLALPLSVDAGPFLPHLFELMGAFDALELRLVRGDQQATAAALQEGAADLAICGPEAMAWERFESWPLFDEPVLLAAPEGHRLANRDAVALAELAGETWVQRPWCESHATFRQALEAQGVAMARGPEAGDDRDAAGFLAAGRGVAAMPASIAQPPQTRRLRITSPELRRRLCVWAVNGRRRGPAAAMLLTQLRAGDWTAFQTAGAPGDPSSAEAPAAPAGGGDAPSGSAAASSA